MNERPGRADLAALAGFVGLACLFFWPILFTNAILTGYDTVTIFYPHRTIAARALLTAHLPLWNPDHFLGAPLLANPQVAVFYPLNWPFLSLPPGPSLAYTMALHFVLAGTSMYMFARSTLGLIGPAAWFSGLVFAFGGFMAQQTGHLNQVSVAAWLPLVLLLGDRVWRHASPRRIAACALVVCLQFLAGHTQESYMILLVLACYVIYLSLTTYGVRRVQSSLRQGAAVGLAVALGVALAAIQLLPTLELSRLSVRSGGLSFRQASSFSLNPLDLPLALLPNFSAAPPNEMAAYVGIVALLLAVCGALWHPRRSEARFLALLGGLGLLLALGRYTPVYWAAYYGLPGISLFRVPARWLLMYSFAAALLAGMGLQVVRQRTQAADLQRFASATSLLCVAAAILLGLGAWFVHLHLPQPATIVLWLLISAGFIALLILGLARRSPALFGMICIMLTVAELYLGGRYLEYNHFSAPESLSAVRPAIAYLQAQDSRSRVLSISDATWDPGDLSEIKSMLAGVAPARVADYVDGIKNKELLTANLPELFGISSADGYDGGVLPLKRYVDLEELFLPAADLSPDGRLRDHLRAIPDARLLGLLNVEYAITDKNSDVWIDNVYYDMAFETAISRTLALSVDRPLVASAAGLIARVEGLPSLADGTVVAQITIAGQVGRTVTVDVVAGEHTALQGQATNLRLVDHPFSGQYVHAVLPLQPIVARSVSVRYMLATGRLTLRGLSLIDQRTDASESLPVSADFQVVHSGDVKIYRNLRVLPRAYAVHTVGVVEGGQSIAQALREAGFEPAQEAIVEQPLVSPLQQGRGSDGASILVDDPQRVVIDADLASAGLLVLTDAYYPGWLAIVDGSPAPILRVNGIFRGLELTAGKHRVEFSYRPRSLLWGGVISLAVVAVSAGLMAASAFERLRNRRWRLHEIHD